MPTSLFSITSNSTSDDESIVAKINAIPPTNKEDEQDFDLSTHTKGMSNDRLSRRYFGSLLTTDLSSILAKRAMKLSKGFRGGARLQMFPSKTSRSMRQPLDCCELIRLKSSHCQYIPRAPHPLLIADENWCCDEESSS